MDIVELGMDVDSRPLKKTGDEMDRFVRQGKRVDGAARGVEQSSRAMAAGVSAAAKSLVALVAAAGSLRAIGAASQQFTQMTNIMRSMGQNADQAAATIQAIADVANRTRAPLEATAKLYQRISIAGRDLGASSQEVLRFTENVGLALAQSGTSAQEASGALLQLSQAMAGGVVRAEEFNSILEGAFPIALAAAEGIDAAGGSVGRLRQLVIEGKISSDEFFNAILSQTAQLEAAFADTVPTIGQAFTVLNNNLTTFVGGMDQATGASAAIAESVLFLAENLQLGVTIAGTAATAFGVKYVAAMVLANTHTLTLAASMKVLSAAMVRTGIGALIVGAGVLVDFLIRLSSSTAKWGDVLTDVFEVGKEVFLGVGRTAWGLSEILAGVASAITGSFVRAFAEIAKSWDALVNGMATAWNAIADTALGESLGFGTMGQSNISGTLGGLADGLFDQAVQSIESGGARIKSAGESVKTAMADLNATVNAGADTNGEAAAEARRLAAALNNGDSSLGGSAKKSAKEIEDLRKEIERLEFDADPVKKYNAELAKLKELREFGLSDDAFRQGVQELNDELANQIPMVGDVADAWADFVTRGFQDFKGFAESILDSFKNLISQMIATAARNKILIGLGVTGGGVGGAANAAGGGLGGGGGGLLGNLLGGGSQVGIGPIGALFGGATNALGAFSGGIGSGLASIGGQLATTLANPSLQSIAASIGAVAGPLAIAAGAISVISGLFKKEVTKSGVRFYSEGGEFGLTQFTTKENKIGGKDTDFDPVSAEFQEGFDKAIDDIKKGLSGAAETLGFEMTERFTEVWDGFVFRVDLKDLDDAQIQEKLTEAFNFIAEGFVENGLGSRDLFEQLQTLRKEGESTADAFTRLGNALRATNRFSDLIGGAGLGNSFTGGVDASSFADLFGGIQQMGAAIDGFVNAIFSQSEILEMRQNALDEVFASLELSVPNSRDAFRDLVAAQDLSTEAGREAAATLIRVSGEFSALKQVADDAAAAIEQQRREEEERAKREAERLADERVREAERALREAEGAVRDAFRAERDRINAAFDKQIEAAQASADASNALSRAQAEEADRLRELRIEELSDREDALRDRLSVTSNIFDMLQTAFSRRGPTTVEGQGLQLSGATSFLQSAVNSRGTRDEQGLENALDVVADPSKRLFSSFKEYQQSFNVNTNLIERLKDFSENSLSREEEALIALQTQIEVLENTSRAEVRTIEANTDAIERAREEELSALDDQMNALLGINNSVLSVRDAILLLRDAQAEVADAVAFQQSLSGDGSLPSFDGGGFTGTGSRTGGVDGRGGFEAILHPNEQVTDLTLAPRNRTNDEIASGLREMSRRLAEMNERQRDQQIETRKMRRVLEDWNINGQPGTREGAVLATEEVV